MERDKLFLARLYTLRDCIRVHMVACVQLRNELCDDTDRALQGLCTLPRRLQVVIATPESV